MYIKPYTQRVTCGLLISQRQEASLYYDGDCSASGETEPSHRARSWPPVQSTMNECVGIAKGLGVRAIYRGNFEVNCADDRMQATLNGTGWEWWDNRRLPADVWQSVG
jgi:hypothetical protein